MSHRDQRSTHFTNRHQMFQDDDSDENCHASESSYFRVNKDVVIDIPSFPDEEKRTDNDSGIYNSSKATTSLCSNSDQEESEGEERAASFDYFPSATKVTPMYHNEYDEAYDVESDKASQNDIESPRSDKSGNKESDQDFYPGTEMETFRTYSRGQDDFETSEDSDDEVKFAPHRTLYNERRSRNYYTPMTQESTEEYGEMTSSTFSFDKSRKALKDNSASSLRRVDDHIHFPLSSPTPSRYSNFTRYDKSKSTGVHVEKSVYSRHHDDMFSGEKDPPFGHGKDQVDKVGKSICSLLTNSCSSVDDMPEGRPIAQSLDLADDGRRKKKKKRGSKDDLDDKTRRNSDYDENGNPIDRYYQMRGSPKLGSSSSVIRKNYTGASSFPQSLRDFSPYSLGGTPISELESSPFHQSHDLNRTEKKVRKKIKKEKVSLSEEVENYVGNKEIDELLDFIDGDKNGRKPAKKNSQTITNEVAVVSKSTEKNNKKNKDKKLNKPINEEKCEVKETKEEKSEAKIIDETTPLINSNKTDHIDYKTQSVQNHDDDDKKCVINESHLNVINRMGNTTAKNSSDENTDSQERIETIITNEIDIKHSVSLPVEEITMEAKIEQKVNCVPSESVEKTIKKDKKSTIKSVEKQNLSNKPKGKGVNSKIENCIVNGFDADDSVENISTKPKSQTNNIKHRTMEKSANKETYQTESGLNGMITNNNKDKTSLFLNELDLVQNEDYRFTDFEPLRKEPEFQVVGGKKKKKVPTTKEIISAKETLVPPKPFKREERRKAPRSVTPPPLNKLSSNIGEQGERTRDLSPSAFPALGSSNQPGFRDARRNSTGDVRMEVQSIIKAQDDSDIESVKSLPASSQGAWLQNSLSPRLPVSYAKMAASPKPSVTSLGSSTADDEPEETSMDLKAANWKGQIKERRHSIGSHPENLKEIESSSIKQKYGSQEVLNVCDQDVVIVDTDFHDEDVVLVDTDFPKVGFDSKFVSTTNSIKNEESNTSLCSSVSFGDVIPSDTNIIDSQLTVSYSKTCESETAKQINEDLECSLENDKSNSDSSYKVSDSRKICETNNAEKVKSVKQTAINNSKRVKQSVIFMDKRVSQAPRNLGISFFFDSANESDVADNNSENIQKCSSSILQSSSSNIPKTSDSKNLGKNSSENSVIDKKSISNINKELGTDSSPKSHLLAGKNGIIEHIINPNVQNKHLSHKDNTITFIGEPNQIIEEAAQISSHSKLSNSKEQSNVSQSDKVVLITIGDRMIDLEVNSLPKDDKCKQQLFFRQDSGDNNSNQRFNFPEAVSYLNKEWEKALEGSRKYPNEVLVYKA
ncbi:uncharacterized protein LOC143075436 isoform X2 [Mytilus galloprovincialis]